MRIALVAPPPSSSSRRARRLARIALSLVLSVAAMEAAARIAGVRPKDESAANPNEPIMHAPHPVRGWSPIPGRYVIPPYAPGAPSILTTIAPDGSRVTAAAPAAGQPEVLVVGCSFAFGWAISDDETMLWHLQERHPELHFVNRAVKAYGTYQALLLLEEMLAAGARPTRVIYALHQSHEERNVAETRWLGMLERFSRQGGVALPYATLRDDGMLERHAPEPYPALPLRGRLATVALLEDVLLARTAGPRVAEKRRVIEALILAMRDLCARHGVRFDVLLLQASPRKRAEYIRFFDRAHVGYADCVVPIPATARVPGEGHPGPMINERWAACVEEKLLESAT
ncbi:MAG: hypothetical protein FJ148_19225 [Deltaproteobacteria bacterium]|nr:hypothetical protein [Deltaproteobacteria bacterium]